MIEKKDLPSEYVSIRQIWLKGIEDCRKAIANVAMIESSSDMKQEFSAAPRTVVHSVYALLYSLVDYGEATIATDVWTWYEKIYKPENNAIWDKKPKKPKDGEYLPPSQIADEKERSIGRKWWDSVNLAEELYRCIIQTLNKYGMLFPEEPKGYSNVEMKSV